MQLSDYFGQTEVYFSESQRRLVPISDMAPPYAVNAFKKLCEEFGEDFEGTPLYTRFLAYVTPSRVKLHLLLEKHGKASLYVGDHSPIGLNTARSRLYRAGARRTWRHGDILNGDFGEIVITSRKAGR